MTVFFNEFWQGDCIDLFTRVPDKSVNMVFADLPYNTTRCNWDKDIIDLQQWWAGVGRVLAPGGCVVMTASEPYTSKLMVSKLAWYRIALVWEKTKGGNFLDAKKRPLKRHEDIRVFAPTGSYTYNPQMAAGKPYKAKNGSKSTLVGNFENGWVTENTGTRYPITVIKIPNEGGTWHPTQKPIALMEYLIKTYSHAGDLILDPAAGSGSTAIAARNTGRQYLLMEKDPAIYDRALARLGAGYN